MNRTIDIARFFEDIGGVDNFRNVSTHASVDVCDEVVFRLFGYLGDDLPLRDGLDLAYCNPLPADVSKIPEVFKELAEKKIKPMLPILATAMCSAMVVSNDSRIVLESLDETYTGPYVFGEDIYKDIIKICQMINPTYTILGNQHGEITDICLGHNIAIPSQQQVQRFYTISIPAFIFEMMTSREEAEMKQILKQFNGEKCILECLRDFGDYLTAHMYPQFPAYKFDVTPTYKTPN